MILGVLSNASTTETLLNNLAEADFDLSNVSVIMRDLKQRNAIAQDGGPLKGASLSNISDRLIQAGLSSQEARLYRDAVAQGKVLIAMMVLPESQQAAKEMLQDYSAELIRE